MSTNTSTARRTTGVAMVDWHRRGEAVQLLLNRYAKSSRFRNDLESFQARSELSSTGHRMRNEYNDFVEIRRFQDNGNPKPPIQASHVNDRDVRLIFSSPSEIRHIISGDDDSDVDTLRVYIDTLQSFADCWGLSKFPEGIQALHQWFASRQVRRMRWTPDYFGYQFGFIGALPVIPEIEPFYRLQLGFQPEWRPTNEPRGAATDRLTRELREWLDRELDRIQDLYDDAGGYAFYDTCPTLERNVH